MKKRMLLSLLIIVVISAIFSCSKKSTDPTENETPTFEETGDIDENGGIVQITDEQSDLEGAYVNIPENALDTSVTISITEGENEDFADSTAVVVIFEPSGLQFDELVQIAIPYEPGSDIEHLQIYTYDEINENWFPIPVISVDTQNGVVIGETMHFSMYVTGEYSDIFDIQAYRKGNNRLALHLEFLPTLANTQTSPYGFLQTLNVNMQQVVEYGWDIHNPISWFEVKIKEQGWFGSVVSTLYVRYRITGNNGYEGYYLVSAEDGEGDSIFTPEGFFTINELSEFMSGKAIIFESETLDPNETYEAQIRHCFSNGEYINNYDNYFRRFTYVFNPVLKNIKISELSNVPSSLDEDGDNIVNDYDDIQGENLDPEEPSNPSPPDNAINISIDTNLNWDCTDPDEDPLTYDVYFGTDSTPDNGELVSQNQSSDSFDLDDLSYDIEHNTDYYWKIVAHDDHSNTTNGDVWQFTTAGIGQQPPSLPTNPSPTDGAQNISIYNVNLDWDESIDPNGDDVEYWVALNTDNSSWGTGNIIYEGSNNYYTISFDLEYDTPYYWVVYAVDEYGNASVDTGNSWSFTTVTESSGDIPTDYIAYYPFNGNANDESGNGHNGNPQPNVDFTAEDRFGNPNSAVFINSGSKYITIPENESLNLQEHTISAWCKFEDGLSSSLGGIFNNGNAIDHYALCCGDSFIRTWINYPNSSNDEHRYDTTVLSDEEYHHITVSYDLFTRTIWIDGVLASTMDFNEPISYANSENCYIGMNFPGGDDWFPGSIDDIRIYNRALTESEIQALYHEGDWDE